MTTTKLRMTAPRSRRHEVEWTSERLTDRRRGRSGHDLDRMIGCAKLDQPRRRAARTGQLEVVAGQPDDEDLGLDRALDVEAIWEPRHGPIVHPSAA